MDRIAIPPGVKSSVTAAAILGAACERADIPVAVEVSSPIVASVVIETIPDPLHAFGDSVQLHATALSAENVVLPELVVWHSKDTTVVTVSASGLVTAVGNGRSIVVATVEGHADSVSMLVEQRVSLVEISPGTDTLTSMGDSLMMNADGVDGRGNPVLSSLPVWTSSDTLVVTIDATGVVYPVSNGFAIIRVSMDNATDSALIGVRQDVSLIALRESTTTFSSVGERFQFVAEALDASGRLAPEAQIVWSSLDTSVVDINAGGSAISFDNGVVALEARVGDVKRSLSVTVDQVAVSLDVAPQLSDFAALNHTIGHTVSAFDANGYPVKHKPPTWSSDREGVATVSDDGNITSVANGTAVVFAHLDDVEDSVVIRVQQIPSVVHVSPQSLTLVEGSSHQLVARVGDKNGFEVPDVDLAWVADDPTVVDVANDGTVSAQSLGTTEVHVFAADLAATAEVTVDPLFTVHGLNFSPYMDGQDPTQPCCRTVPEEQLRERTEIVAPYTQWIRTFGCGDGLELAGRIAHEFGLQVALGAWLSTDSVVNEAQIGCLIDRARAGEVDMAVVGGEVLLRDDFDELLLLDYIQRVKTALPETPVTYNGTHDQLLAHPVILDAVDVVLANIYPYWEGVPISEAIQSLDRSYRLLVAAAGGKDVIIGETGWPSCGDTIGAAEPTPINANRFFFEFQAWTQTNDVSSFYFEAYDEAWKVINEGPQGACWGLWDSVGQLKLTGPPPFVS